MYIIPFTDDGHSPNNNRSKTKMFIYDTTVHSETHYYQIEPHSQLLNSPIQPYAQMLNSPIQPHSLMFNSSNLPHSHMLNFSSHQDSEILDSSCQLPSKTLNFINQPLTHPVNSDNTFVNDTLSQSQTQSEEFADIKEKQLNSDFKHDEYLINMTKELNGLTDVEIKLNNLSNGDPDFYDLSNGNTDFNNLSNEAIKSESEVEEEKPLSFRDILDVKKEDSDSLAHDSLTHDSLTPHQGNMCQCLEPKIEAAGMDGSNSNKGLLDYLVNIL